MTTTAAIELLPADAPVKNEPAELMLPVCADSKAIGVDIRDPDGRYRLFDRKLCRSFLL